MSQKCDAKIQITNTTAYLIRIKYPLISSNYRISGANIANLDFVEICNIYVRKVMIKATKRIYNSDKICRNYSDLNFGVTFLGHSVYTPYIALQMM